MSTPEHPALTWGAQLAWGIASLRDASPSPRLDASVLLARLLDVPRTVLMAYGEREIASAVAAQYADWIVRRADGEPVAYLTGHKEFMGLDFTVDRRVLIPRPETELLVEAAINVIAARFGDMPTDEDAPPPRGAVPDVLAADIGTGSGAIAIALAQLESRIGRIYAVDLSADALAVAQHNGDRLHVSDRITWLNGDLLAPVPVSVDLIVANLPYVSDKPDEAQPGVVKYEPHLALFGDDGGLGHLRRLIAAAPAKLNPGGVLVLEFGYDQRAALTALITQAFPQASMQFGTDYAGWDRYVIVRH